MKQGNVIVVDINGTPHEIGSSDIPDFDILARRSENRYMVLASNEGDLFDPFDTGLKIKKRDVERGGMFWRIRTCSKECFAQYTTFLRSKNRTPYILAQRRYRSDYK